MTPDQNSTQIFNAIMKDMLIGNPNRRNYDRVPWRTTIEVQPLTEDLSPCEDSFQALSSDISREGLGIVAPILPTSPYIRITVPETEVAMFATIIHTTDIGDDYPQYLIGTEFMQG